MNETCHIRGPILWVNVFVATPENREKTDAELMDLVAETIHTRIAKKTTPFSVSITPEPMHHRVMGCLSLPARGNYWAFTQFRDLHLDGFLRDALELALFYQAECEAGNIQIDRVRLFRVFHLRSDTS
ncbi:hypothetical protein PDIG_09770 [Penicillium digitatum PHI26]|uniref:Uncharacterized protein n=2 Tax=Penicillium digitatum TaxID=36651 RepID=K9GVM3_PEND2|nr:hypothetical protein PDIP_40360 [Penicillium digitatum Pd1]EKV15516.1 hypothetical protein PDIP_40360 [Penicillium digitatum Pd1]EKV18663.1 hypothetical protein PDIG_09770 [Penicillium digitatum PHI26]